MCNVEGPPLKKLKPHPLHDTEPLPIYLDFNATTPLCPEAWDAMTKVSQAWGNPSSTHPYGLNAKFYLDFARQSVSDSLHSPSPDCIIFTSGGTESNNLAIIGGSQAVRRAHQNRKFIISTNVEHPAVAEVLKHLLGSAFEFLLFPVSPTSGVAEPEAFQAFLENKVPGGPQNVALVTIMFSNNEIGSINPISELVRVTKQLCGEACLFHTDAAQALGKIPVDVQQLGVDLLSVCGHKFYAPKGSGALFIRKGVHVDNVTYGAGHEKGIRPGTENVLIATGMAKALSLAVEHIEQFSTNMRQTRDELYKVLKEELQKNNLDFTVNGDLAVALPNTLNCALYKKIPNPTTGEAVTYISAPRLLIAVGNKVCMSAGSACHSTTDEEIEVSAPLKAIQVNLTRAIGTLRISTGRDTTLAEARRAARVVARTAAQQFAE